MNVYCFDSSALMDMWNTMYPPDVFGVVWTALEEAIAAGAAIAPKEVLREIEDGRDELVPWAKRNKQMFIEEDEELYEVAHQVAHTYPNLIDAGKNGIDADPWIIALASQRNAIVITHEKKTGHKKFGMKEPRVKIPDVCDFMGLKRATVAEFLRDRGVRLG
jgi:hypothetical protein